MRSSLFVHVSGADLSSKYYAKLRVGEPGNTQKMGTRTNGSRVKSSSRTITGPDTGLLRPAAAAAAAVAAAAVVGAGATSAAASAAGFSFFARNQPERHDTTA